MKKSLLLLLLWCNNVFAGPLHFVSINYLIEQEVGRLVLPEIYRQLNVTIVVTPYPGKRAQQLVRSGKRHGEIMRIYSYGDENPNTIRVPTPYYTLETMAFVRSDSHVDIQNEQDLSNYRIAKVRGVKHTNNITKGMSEVEDTDTTIQALNLVSKGLADIALTNRIDGLVMLAKAGIENVVPHQRSFRVLKLYHYIHKDQRHWVKKIDDVLRRMTQSGELTELIKKAENQVISQHCRQSSVATELCRLHLSQEED
ncbi:MULTISPECIES: transporter substrate-binding domain-containing protein [unclassified Pseudoalteromonas]|uniref:substrate-binding periplasmic protein n=1 Tax=unclassified Pseudoalteromonas TaxID=194690 RepID=UPI002097F2ED|nr:transporter substrate-binding domain-containing protein [Pseudoalteromonas sp. XMcav2-N]MCO7187157.1 transporter substrate-binding domain-containing protein [Pseudoalteromonas sp. XMcav2-N]